MSDDELAFLARIREVPDDDAPRLVYADWLDPFLPAVVVEPIRKEVKDRLHRSFGGITWHRGFVDTITCSLGDFLRFAKLWFDLDDATSAIREVKITDADPEFGLESQCWFWSWARGEDEHWGYYLPRPLFEFLIKHPLADPDLSGFQDFDGEITDRIHDQEIGDAVFDTEEDANKSLSDACIQYGYSLHAPAPPPIP